MIIVKVENIIQLDEALKKDYVSDIIISRDSFLEEELESLVNKIKKKNINPWILLERISRYEEINSLRLDTDKIFSFENLYGLIIQNIDSFSYVLRKINFSKNKNLKIKLNYNMNCYNNETKKLFSKIYNEKRENSKDNKILFTAPIELSKYELEDIFYDEILIYSYIDTMVTANCLRKNTNLNCLKLKNDNKITFSSFIKDRKNKNLYYKTYCKYCYNKIFNVEPLYLIDLFNDKIKKNDKYYRIDFSFESIEQVKKIFNIIDNIFSGMIMGNEEIDISFTRGHYKNSIK